MNDDVYTPAQASAVADLPLKAVHKLIDGRLIRPRRMRVGRESQRFLSQGQLVYLRLEPKASVCSRLPHDGKWRRPSRTHQVSTWSACRKVPPS